MKRAKVLFMLSVFALLMVGTISCKKYRKYDNMEVVENTYPGTITVTSVGNDPAGDFTGNGDSGTYSFVWDNPNEKAQVNFDITTNSGSVEFHIMDAKGNEVLHEVRSAGGNDTFAGMTEEGKKGKWLIEIKLSNFDGDGSFSISPA